MATNMLEQRTFPCESATIQEISDALWYAAEGKDEHITMLQHSTYPILPDQISWSELRFLGILGKEKNSCNVELEKSGLYPGFYISYLGDALILIHQDDTHIQRYMDLCGENTEILEIYNTSLSALNISSFANLRELLVVENKALSSLEGLEQLTQLTYLNLCDCSQTPDLSAVGALPHLTTLLIQDCDKLINFPSLLELTQLKSLTLRKFSDPEVLAHLGKLTQLDTLRINSCNNLTALPGLEKLTELTTLEVFRCGQLTTLPELKKLTKLTSLELSQCSNLTALPGLENLTQLTSLDLSWCRNITTLPGLENLTQLTSLDLSRCRSLSVLSSLEELTQLTSLNLSGCSSLSVLSGLEKLTQLTSLDLSGCSSLSVLSGLEELTQLTSLNLSGCSSLSVLSGLEKLTQLTSLDLSGCSSLSVLSSLDELTQLTYLNLSRCNKLTVLPESIYRLPILRRLDLRHMHLRDLPDWFPEIAEQFSLDEYSDFLPHHFRHPGHEKAIVYLAGTIVENVDIAVFQQPYEMVVRWFEERKAGRTQPLNEIKVVFLGDGEAGKSHTIARLMNDGGDPDDYTGQATPGIVIKHKDYEVDGRTFRVNYWDFGGQEIMHSMHRIFLTGRTMYVVLLNARDDTQCDRAKYWLHNIKSFAPDAPVLLVLNKIDQNPNASVDERDLRGRCEKLTKVVRLSAKDFNREDFNREFTDVLKSEIIKTGFLDSQWPTNWKQVKDKLENMKSHYIMGDAYEDICQKCQVEKNRKELLHWFNDLGVSFCCCDKEDYALEDYVILRPDWITNALYILLFNPLEGAQNGLIPHDSIYQILKTAHNNPDIKCTLRSARYNSSDIGYVLGVMRKFNLSQPHGTDHEFIPMLCQQNSTVDVQSFHKDEKILEFNMEFDYLPNNLLHRLMVDRHSELDMDNVWRTGAKFQLPELGLSAVVVIDGENLRFFIKHTNPMHRPNTYLATLKANVDRIVKKMGLKAPACNLIYKLDGKRDEYDFDELKMLQEVGQSVALSKAWRRMIPIEDILNQSAPDNLTDERRLLNEIIRSCEVIQDNTIYRLIKNENGRGYANGKDMEDLRNRRIRDDLLRMEFMVADQSQRGSGETGAGVGEVDLLLLNEHGDSWTIIEALRVCDGTKAPWNKHLDKLLNKYNTRGLSPLYLLTYVDAEPAAFGRICKRYQKHIKEYNPSAFTYLEDSFCDLSDPNRQFTKTVKCSYSCGAEPITVYHIFTRIPTQNE